MWRVPSPEILFETALKRVTVCSHMCLLKSQVFCVNEGSQVTLVKDTMVSALESALYRASIFLQLYLDFLNILFIFNLPAYSRTPSAHPINCPPQCPSPSHPIPPPLPLPLVRFPGLGVSGGPLDLNCNVGLSSGFSSLLPCSASLDSPCLEFCKPVS